MDRVQIKTEAKKLIKGNKWNLIWPLLVIGVVTSILSNVFGGSTVTVNFNDLEDLSNVQTTSNPLSFVSSLASTFLNIAYIKYVLDFVKTGKFDANCIIDVIKKRWLCILGVAILYGLAVGIGCIFLIVPGIIIALGLSMSTYLAVDTDLGPVDALKKSWEMMKGHKWEYFVFGLSFLGWILLTPFTLFILLIWLGPYMTVSRALYYTKLKKLEK